MNLHYDKASDSLYIELPPHHGFDSVEMSVGVGVDYNKEVHIVGLDIEYAGTPISLNDISSKASPL